MRISIVSSDFETKTIGLFFVKNPVSTTPVIELIFSSISTGFTGFCQRQSKIWFPLSVTTGPHFLTPSRKVHFAPSDSSSLTIETLASGIISTGSANFVPKSQTAFDSSAIITYFFEKR
mgnify:CR=1 FL=1